MRWSSWTLQRLFSTAAPWALAVGLTASFSASAGHAPPNFSRISLAPPFNTRDWSLQVASLSKDWPAAARAPALDQALRGLVFGGDLEPIPTLKMNAAAFPDVDRRLKGDPIPALRPTLSRRGGDLTHQRLTRLERL